MSQHKLNLNNFLSFRSLYRNKYEDACPLFYGDLAIADSAFRILAARGQAFHEGSRFILSETNKRFLSKNLTETRRVVLRQRSRLCWASGELLPVGLYVLLLPIGDRVGLAGAASYLSQTRELALTAAARKTAQDCQTEEGVMAAEDEMSLLDGILRPETGITMLELCERVAYYAGCNIRFDRSIRELSVPQLHCERVRLTAFLLCFALILRKRDPDGAFLSIASDGGSRLRLTVVCKPLPAEEFCPELSEALRYPQFADFCVEWKEE